MGVRVIEIREPVHRRARKERFPLHPPAARPVANDRERVEREVDGARRHRPPRRRLDRLPVAVDRADTPEPLERLPLVRSDVVQVLPAAEEYLPGLQVLPEPLGRGRLLRGELVVAVNVEHVAEGRPAAPDRALLERSGDLAGLALRGFPVAVAE
jgi:hypothetical protein